MNASTPVSTRAATRLAVILGSTREGRRGEAVGRWLMDQLQGLPELTVDLIDPVVLDLPLSPPAVPDDGVIALRERVDSAEGFVVVVPEYNHGYPAALKALIDLVKQPWHGKPVAFVSYGGASGGMRAVEQLRQVFAELHCVTVRESVIFPAIGDNVDAGRLISAERQAGSLKKMLASLLWWSAALTPARAQGAIADQSL